MTQKMGVSIMGRLESLVEFYVVTDGMVTSLRPPMAHRWPWILRNAPDIDQPWLYPVVLSFAYWEFPQGNLPNLWAPPPPSTPLDTSQLLLPVQSDVTLAAMVRDRSCRISSRLEGCDVAHIIPRNELPWFEINGIGNCAIQRRGSKIHDAQNLLIIRQDLRFTFDQQNFTIVPKTTETGQDSPKWVVHLFCNSCLLYHLTTQRQHFSRISVYTLRLVPLSTFGRFTYIPHSHGIYWIMDSTNLEQKEMQCLLAPLWFLGSSSPGWRRSLEPGQTLKHQNRT